MASVYTASPASAMSRAAWSYASRAVGNVDMAGICVADGFHRVKSMELTLVTDRFSSVNSLSAAMMASRRSDSGASGLAVRSTPVSMCA